MKTVSLGLLALSLATSPAGAQPATTQPSAARREARALPGLVAPGTITVDRWGIAHIRAASPRDAFFLQGYAAARDRLWQIDLWRKRGLGRLSASFGPSFVAQDRAARLFLYRGDIAAEWAAYPREARGWTEAFAAGINAFVGDTEAGRQPLPGEFAATGSTPERWSADDIVRIRSNALVSNLSAEVARARALCAGGLQYEPLRRRLEPAHRIILPAGLDPCTIPADVLQDYNLGTGGVRFDGARLVTASADPDLREGSNNWVIAPARSATGRPLLAGDPHRELGVPSLRYIVHLDAPGLHIAGAGEPALPGISFGHNQDIAWALTIFGMDQQDLVVGGDRVRTITETIDVKGEPPRAVALLFTADGPVIHTDSAGRSYALRATWDRPGASAYFNASWFWQARDWAGFTAGRAHWGAPPLNLLYADTKGNIGWTAAGFAPARPASDGLLPVPAGAGGAWAGVHSATDLPSVRNPAKGWFATANEMNLPRDYPNESRRIAFEWADRSRIDRIEQVIAATPRFSLADAMALQTDQHSSQAARAVALLTGVKADTPDAAMALQLLQGWDGHETADSAPAALYEIWTRHHLGQAAFATLPATIASAMGKPSTAAIIAVLETPGGMLAARRDEVLQNSLAAAYGEARTRLGADPAGWRWGSLHKANFVPALSLRAGDTIGPAEMGGSVSTPMAAGTRGDGFGVEHGASVRMVLDVGEWDNSVITNSPGQSADPASPHYRDLFPIWAAGKYIPFLWTPAAIAREAETVIAATP